MPPGNQVTATLPFRILLAMIEEQTHELSNAIGGSMNLLVMQIREANEPPPDRVVQAAELAARATTALQKIMWNLGRLQALADRGQL